MFNVSVPSSVVAIGIGVFLSAGLGAALIVVGVLVLALTLYATERLNRRRS